jgi:hypothetical protein
MLIWSADNYYINVVIFLLILVNQDVTVDRALASVSLTGERVGMRPN